MKSPLQTLFSRPGQEFLLTLGAMLWLVWLGWGFGGADWLRGGENRYQRDRELQVELLPEARRADWLGGICGRFGEWLPAEDRAVCRGLGPSGLIAALLTRWGGVTSAEAPTAAKPMSDEARRRVREALPEMAAAHEALLKGWFEPLAATEQERAEREQHAAEGFVEEGWEDEFRNAGEQTRAYREAYRLEIRGGRAFPKPLECTWAYLARRVEAPGAAGEAPSITALAGLAALLDGRAERLPAGRFWAGAGWDAREARLGCSGSPQDQAREGAALVRSARASAGNAAKAAAVQDILPMARWCMAAWALAGLLVLALGRRGGRLNRVLFVSLLIWAVAAAGTRPHLEWFGGAHWAWLAGGWKAPLMLALAALAALYLPGKRAIPPAAPSSALGYPGFVLFAGLGWWLLLDLSATGHVDNRFQGLYQQGHVFAAFLLVSLVPALRAPLAEAGLKAASFWPLAAAGETRRAWVFWGLGLLAAAVLLGLVWAVLRGHRQLTSEIFRFLLVVGLAWVLLARADRLVSPWLIFPPRPGERWPRLGAWWRALPYRLKLAAPLFPLLLLVFGGLLATDDKGPLLVVLYAAAVFVGVGVALPMSRWIGWPLGIAGGMAALGVYVWGVSFALLRYGGLLGARIRERVESAQQPFLASNDQMAHVLWFQEAAADAGGFGFGAVPWCGEIAGACRGVPPQIQSDYIFTALLGVFGPWAWGILALCGVWLWRVARSHPAATSGRVDADDPGQAWLSWMALCWVGLSLTQMAVTVAGNLCWLPLTGITFPFVSYGSWSLLANALFLGLALNLNRRAP